jgi:hypothetical protein
MMEVYAAMRQDYRRTVRNRILIGMEVQSGDCYPRLSPGQPVVDRDSGSSEEPISIVTNAVLLVSVMEPGDY